MRNEKNSFTGLLVCQLIGFFDLMREQGAVGMPLILFFSGPRGRHNPLLNRTSIHIHKTTPFPFPPLSPTLYLPLPSSPNPNPNPSLPFLPPPPRPYHTTTTTKPTLFPPPPHHNSPLPSSLPPAPPTAKVCYSPFRKFIQLPLPKSNSAYYPNMYKYQISTKLSF